MFDVHQKAPWRLIIDDARSPKMNMALDMAILEAVVSGESLPTLRFYAWSTPAVSLGFHQKAERVLDLDVTEKAGIEVVTRPTGGRAVLHGDDLTYSVALVEAGMWSNGITEVYRLLSQALQAGFSKYGIKDVTLARGHRGEVGPGPQPCFSSTARYELLWAGKKLVGSAQKRHKGGVLQQGSIPLRDGEIRPEDLLPEKFKPARRGNGWATVEEAHGVQVNAKELAMSIAYGFSYRLDVDMTLQEPNLAELAAAKDLMNS